MMNSIEILRTTNGYTAIWKDGDGYYLERSFEESESQWGEVECFSRLLWWITEHFGMIGTKHDAKRIRITTGDEDGND